MAESALLSVYRRAPLQFVRGEGAWLFDAKGNRYLDFASGIGVNAFGYGHAKLAAALHAQSEKPWHVSNLYDAPEQEKLARRLVQASFAERVFFCNSGAEAVEGSIKLVRKYHAARGAPERTEIVTFAGAFHGRTLGALAAGGDKNPLDGLGPAPPT
ncbi:MAG: aminotransferase class III-fold pyridoxal phosphate-dependent enzyme [Hyphomicrobiales bacterium]|nr:aminotransferase class III-fold pyridoxal phosphate-dependent enzyme [Hyphomicrobiales bacterium]